MIKVLSCCHSAADEESLFSSIFKRGDPLTYSLRMTDKGKLTKILKHSLI
jgi:hypothetical protein